MTAYDFHPEARVDLDEIWEYIAADNLNAADRVIAEVLAAIRALVPLPGVGHKRPNLTSRPLRFILVREYLIAYAPDEWRRSSEVESDRNPRPHASSAPYRE
jgi:toxin ParE1/3/4